MQIKPSYEKTFLYEYDLANNDFHISSELKTLQSFYETEWFLLKISIALNQAVYGRLFILGFYTTLINILTRPLGEIVA